MYPIKNIHVMICEPTTDSGVGAWEWRLDRTEAEKIYRTFRGNDHATYLFTDVAVPEEYQNDGEAIYEWVDSIYCEHSHDRAELVAGFGTEPTAEHIR